MTTTFTQKQLDTLRSEWASIERVDPFAPAAVKLRRLMDELSREQLEQLRDADINFISILALTRLLAKNALAVAIAKNLNEG